jgi:hypothetical protein
MRLPLLLCFLLACTPALGEDNQREPSDAAKSTQQAAPQKSVTAAGKTSSAAAKSQTSPKRAPSPDNSDDDATLYCAVGCGG